MINRYKYLKHHIKSEIDTVNELYQICLGGKSLSDFEKERIQSSHKPDSPQIKTLMKIVELKNKMENERNEMLELYEKISSILGNLNPRYEHLIREIDLNEKEYKDVASELGINSIKYLMNLHSRATIEFRKVEKSTCFLESKVV